MLKYNLSQKARSVAVNLLRTHYKDIINYAVAKVNQRYKLNMEVNFGGDITQESDYDDRDYIMSAEEIAELPVLNRVGTKLHIIDQGKSWRIRNSCVPTNILMSICNNLFTRISYQEYLEWLNWLEVKGLWFEHKGASIPKVVKAICKRWNEIHPEYKVRFDRYYYTDEKLHIAKQKGYQVVGGRNTFSSYSDDKKDGVINMSNYAGWKRAGGHCNTVMNGKAIKLAVQTEILPNNSTRQANGVIRSDGDNVVNSYPTTHGSVNIYAHPKLPDHCKNLIWYSWFYVITPLEATDPKEKEPTRIKNLDNKYYDILKKKIDAGYNPLFEDYFDDKGETKALIDIGLYRFLKRNNLLDKYGK